MAASALLTAHRASDADIDAAMAGNICRCGTTCVSVQHQQAATGKLQIMQTLALAPTEAAMSELANLSSDDKGVDSRADACSRLALLGGFP